MGGFKRGVFLFLFTELMILIISVHRQTYCFHIIIPATTAATCELIYAGDPLSRMQRRRKEMAGLPACLPAYLRVLEFTLIYIYIYLFFFLLLSRFVLCLGLWLDRAMDRTGIPRRGWSRCGMLCRADPRAPSFCGGDAPWWGGRGGQDP